MKIKDCLFYADQLISGLKLEEAHQLLSNTLKHTRDWQLYAKRSEVCSQTGNSQAALEDLEQAIDLAQNAPLLDLARLYSRQIILLWSLADSWQQIQPMLQQYKDRFETPKNVPAASQYKNSGQLKIGYLSPDFRICSAAMMFETLFEHHPQESIEIYAYDLLNSGDEAQSYFKEKIPHWRQLAGLTVEQSCEQIQHDGLDILIDLAGHTSLSGLAILGRKPAPVQFSGLTFNGPIGLQSVYRFTDLDCSPDPFMNEGLCYLPSWIIIPYQPEVAGRSTKAIPEQGQNLGCAHHPGRISPQSISCWAEILKANLTSHLHLKHRLYESPWCRQHILNQFKQRAVKAERIHFYAASPYLDYLTFYQDMDLILDPFPYHGGLVSCDALWMGVPMITMAQWTRGGESLLKQIDFLEGIAPNSKAYITQALEILAHRDLRKAAAQNFRARMRKSAICHPSKMSQGIVQHAKQLLASLD